MTAAIVDTGPLVAFFDRAEQHHRWVAARIEEFDAPLLYVAEFQFHYNNRFNPNIFGAAIEGC